IRSERVTDCRDNKDNKYLELALASGAGVIVSGDDDLLALHPWRGVRILRPAAYLAGAEALARDRDPPFLSEADLLLVRRLRDSLRDASGT
ncbi:MAG: putative toxin-antitoxin system toxin component, PIN family, partial [Acetobacteraceae bacterium]|nr:putative toxin-antitoxin system toxin component, PIN family [Acetobacteraceae bacterium]